MSVTGKIDALLRNEHAQLQRALPELDGVIVALQPVAMNRAATPVPQPRYATHGPRSTPPPAPSRTFTPRRLQEAWAVFSQSLQGHMDKEQRILLPLARSVAEGQMRFRTELGTVATQALAEHADLRKHAAAVRGETLQLPAELSTDDLRRSLLDVLELFETHSRIEEVEIYGPLCWAENLSDTPVPARWRTSDDVLKSLRTTRPEPVDEPTEEETEETSPGLFTRMKKLFGG